MTKQEWESMTPFQKELLELLKKLIRAIDGGLND